VLPLIKKPSLDPDELRNYRPISNLPALFKIIERAAVSQLQRYLDENHLHAKMQSAYRPCHSTETALLRIHNDLLRAIDQHQEAVLILLDLTAAFDTIDHRILLERLSKRYGISGRAHAWFTSYLQGRTQRVVIKDAISDSTHLDCGVPQGSVAGPIKFVMYNAPLEDIIDAHGINSIMYADDTQLYVLFHPDERDSAISKIEACVKDVKMWAIKNKLALNDSKTEVILFLQDFVIHTLLNRLLLVRL
jgi:retron-type reverse transcriptase